MKYRCVVRRAVQRIHLFRFARIDESKFDSKFLFIIKKYDHRRKFENLEEESAVFLSSFQCQGHGRPRCVRLRQTA